MPDIALWCIAPPVTTRPAPTPKPGEWRFCVTTLNGRRYYAIEHHNHGGPREGWLGATARYELTAQQMEQNLDALIVAFQAKEAAAAQEPAAADTRPSWERDPVLRAAMIVRLNAIIRQSTEHGEVQNAMALYKKLTGADWRM
jgi:hypothetical protein